MARGKGKIDADFLDELDQIDAQDQKDLDNLDKVGRGGKAKIGLVKSSGEKADKREIYLLTGTEQKKLNDYCHEHTIKKSALIRKLLREKGVFGEIEAD
jgi:hypothetical protein